MNILSCHYLPCVHWFALLLKGDVVIDMHEHYTKQSYRNRCNILSANGPLALTIPVKKKETKQAMHSIQIEQEFNWQKQHWEALVSAYNSSPYFFYYRDHFEPLYTQPQTDLCTFNLELVRLCLRLLKIENVLRLSDAYVQAVEADADYREILHPKRATTLQFTPYLQVFSEKFSFTPNLSIVDLLFNEGPAAMAYLQRIVTQLS